MRLLQVCAFYFFHELIRDLPVSLVLFKDAGSVVLHGSRVVRLYVGRHMGVQRAR